METSILEKFGFKFNKRSVHTGRTIMLEELSKLIEAVPEAIKNMIAFENLIMNALRWYEYKISKYGKNCDRAVEEEF